MDVMSTVEENILEEGHAIAILYLRKVLKEKGITIELLENQMNNVALVKVKLTNYIKMQVLCEEMRKSKKTFFDGICCKLDVTPESAEKTFLSVSQLVFSEDRKINWGRIAAFLTFAGKFAVHFGKEDDIVAKVPYWIKDILRSYLVTWIAQHDGWVCIKTYFHKFLRKISWKNENHFFTCIVNNNILPYQ